MDYGIGIQRKTCLDVKNIGYKCGRLDIYFIMKQLSEKDKKTLDIFSMYLQSYGSKVGKYTIQVSTDGEVYWDWKYWYGDSTRMSIESYDSIDELIERIFNENQDTMLENFSSDDRGNVVAIVNCNDRTLTFKADVYITSTQHHSVDYTFDDISNQEIREWLSDIKEAFVSGDIHYEGSGDSGYIEEDITYNDNTRDNYPNQLENWMYRELEQFGGWEINEGAQGDFHFNFQNGTIHLEHGENYEDQEIHEIPLKFTF